MHYFTNTVIRSGNPSPVLADVGMIDTYSLMSSFYQYIAILNPYWLSWSLTWFSLLL